MLRIASRSSRLAQAQTALFARVLWHAHPHLKDSCQITTLKSSTPSPHQQRVKDSFTRALDEALLAKHIDCAVHSLKDLPATLAKGLVIACFLPRTEARDALVMQNPSPIKTLRDLPDGTTIATSSLRRQAHLRMHAPHVNIVPMRGDIDTRLDKLHSESRIDGLVLAAAGLQRIGREQDITLILETDVMLPAPGQGMLACVCRDDDTQCLKTLARLDDANSRLCATAERAAVRALGADCGAPVAAYAHIDGQSLNLRAFIADPQGQHVWSMNGNATHDQAQELGQRIGTILREQAGHEFCKQYLTNR